MIWGHSIRMCEPPVPEPPNVLQDIHGPSDSDFPGLLRIFRPADVQVARDLVAGVEMRMEVIRCLEDELAGEAVEIAVLLATVLVQASPGREHL